MEASDTTDAEWGVLGRQASRRVTGHGTTGIRSIEGWSANQCKVRSVDTRRHVRGREHAVIEMRFVLVESAMLVQTATG